MTSWCPGPIINNVWIKEFLPYELRTRIYGSKIYFYKEQITSLCMCLVPFNICIKLCRVRGFLQSCPCALLQEEVTASTMTRRMVAAPALRCCRVAQPAARGARLGEGTGPAQIPAPHWPHQPRCRGRKRRVSQGLSSYAGLPGRSTLIYAWRQALPLGHPHSLLSTDVQKASSFIRDFFFPTKKYRKEGGGNSTYMICRFFGIYDRVDNLENV